MIGELAKDPRRQFGDRGEGLAVQLLERAGYTVLERNFSCRFGEIDIIATQGELHCFVEVRARATDVWGEPVASVVNAKQRKVVSSTIYWLQRQRLLERVPVRFDVIQVIGRGPDARVEHIPGAFDAGL
jgi:putative endonuclease